MRSKSFSDDAFDDCSSRVNSLRRQQKRERRERRYEKADNAEVKILSSEYTLPDDSSTNLHENELILKINVSVKNTGKEPLMVDKSQFSLYEGDSKMSDVSVYDERNKRLRSSTLNSDKEVDGNIYYIVEKGKSFSLNTHLTCTVKIKPILSNSRSTAAATNY